jgi:membrane protein DedA with SNARE-associated domain
MCGISKMNILIYLLFSFLGTLPISGVYIYLGERLGRHWHRAGMIAGKYAVFFGIVLFIVFILYFLLGEKFKRNKD